jgi:AraC-like DNA-binding protein
LSSIRGSIHFPVQSDGVSEVLSHLRVGHVTYWRNELTAPWGLDLPFEDGVRFHYTAEGGCRLVIDEQQIWLDRGDIALAVSGSAHRLLDGSDGWTPALRDPHIGAAIAAIHRDPGRAWTVETLAGLARVSRSTFSARFTDRVGISPKRYIAQLRMRLAVRRLKSDRSSLAQIAAALGYQSEGAFARAFKRTCGEPPGSVRRAASGSV